MCSPNPTCSYLVDVPILLDTLEPFKSSSSSSIFGKEKRPALISLFNGRYFPQKLALPTFFITMTTENPHGEIPGLSTRAIVIMSIFLLFISLYHLSILCIFGLIYMSPDGSNAWKSDTLAAHRLSNYCAIIQLGCSKAAVILSVSSSSKYSTDFSSTEHFTIGLSFLRLSWKAENQLKLAARPLFIICFATSTLKIITSVFIFSSNMNSILNQSLDASPSVHSDITILASLDGKTALSLSNYSEGHIIFIPERPMMRLNKAFFTTKKSEGTTCFPLLSVRCELLSVLMLPICLPFPFLICLSGL